MSGVAPWFDPADLIWIGPAGGVLEATWAGLLGVLAYAMLRHGRGRAILMAYVYAGLIVAVALLTGGTLAWLQRQPLVVCWSLWAFGAPLLIASSLSLFNVTAAYRAWELRRMTAQEI